MLNYVRPIIVASINNLYDNDKFIIKDGQELAISGKLGMYLHDKFTGWSVDCEYNRIGHEEIRKKGNAGEVKRPDIIVHKRGEICRESNLLWVEVKIRNENTITDINKICEFTEPPEGERIIQYQLGLSVSFIDDCKLIWIANGRTILDEVIHARQQ